MNAPRSQRKTKFAITTVTLDRITIDAARLIGNGNLSKGIRQAVAAVKITPVKISLAEDAE
jgi:hypothetical protein